MTAGSHPVIRLRPKASARAIRHGAPWVFEGEIVADRRTRALAPGTIAVLEDAGREALGLVAVNPKSRIMARMLDRDTAARIDRDWLAARLERALALRARLYEAPFYRLVHAEADGLPGVVIDRFGDMAVIQPNAAWAEALLPQMAAAVRAVTGVSTVLKNASGRARSLEGLDEESGILAGTAPDGPVPVPMTGATYMADLVAGQKTGIFYDQRPNHAFAARLARGARVLDVFAHVGGFSLAALAAGADSALAVDSAQPALDLASEGAARTGVASRLETRRDDAFEAMEALAGGGARFDLVICDPPAFAPSKPALEKGLRAYERVARLAAGLVAPGGYLGLCSCSHAADLGRFRAACIRGIGRAGRAPSHGLCRAGPSAAPRPGGIGLSQGAGLPAVRVLLDACVIYPTVMREMLLGVAGAGAYAPLWSERIIGEWRHAAAKQGPEAEAQAAGEAALMAARWPGARVRHAPALEARLWLPDPADTHVLAAAIAGSADGIVTLNARDFPRGVLAEEGLWRADPDGFLHGIWRAQPGLAAEVAGEVLERARRLSTDDWELRPLLKKARLPRLAKALGMG